MFGDRSRSRSVNFTKDQQTFLDCWFTLPIQINKLVHILIHELISSLGDKNQVSLCNRLGMTNHHNLNVSVWLVCPQGGAYTSVYPPSFLPVLYLGHYFLKKWLEGSQQPSSNDDLKPEFYHIQEIFPVCFLFSISSTEEMFCRPVIVQCKICWLLTCFKWPNTLKSETDIWKKKSIHLTFFYSFK